MKRTFQPNNKKKSRTTVLKARRAKGRKELAK